MLTLGGELLADCALLIEGTPDGLAVAVTSQPPLPIVELCSWTYPMLPAAPSDLNALPMAPSCRKKRTFVWDRIMICVEEVVYLSES
jgi:hypothetical protein